MLRMIQCLTREGADSRHSGSPLVSPQTYQGHCNTILLRDLGDLEPELPKKVAAPQHWFIAWQ